MHLDIDAAEIDKLRHADVPVVGPLKDVLAELARASCASCAATARPSRGCRRSPAGASEFPLRYGNGGGMLKPQPVLETLQAT